MAEKKQWQKAFRLNQSLYTHTLQSFLNEVSSIQFSFTTDPFRVLDK